MRQSFQCKSFPVTSKKLKNIGLNHVSVSEFTDRRVYSELRMSESDLFPLFGKPPVAQSGTRTERKVERRVNIPLGNTLGNPKVKSHHLTRDMCSRHLPQKRQSG